MTRYEFALFVWLRNPPSTIGLRQGDKMENAEARLYLATSSLLSFLFHPRPPPPAKAHEIQLSRGGGGAGTVLHGGSIQINGACEVTQLHYLFFWATGQSKGTDCSLPHVPPSKKVTAVILFQHLKPWGIFACPSHSQIPVPHAKDCI